MRRGGGGGQSEAPTNLLRGLRGLSLPPLVIPNRWSSLGMMERGGRGGLKAACTLIGAGAVGALLALSYGPNFTFSSKGTSPPRSTPPELLQSSSQRASSIQGLEDELTVPGLKNVGNNCFLNVILQALASSKAIMSFLTACAEITSRPKTKSTWTTDAGVVSMPLAVSVSSLMKELSELGDKKRTSSPWGVMLALKSYVKDFDLASQQDAAEALAHLASALQAERDEYIQWLKPTLQTFGKVSLILDGRLDQMGKPDLKHSTGRDQLLESWRGHLHWPLEGSLGSSLTCQRCAYQSTTQIQFFNDISLSPLQDRDGNIIQGCKLENCLEQFTTPEWIDDVRCSNCSHDAAAFSIYSIFRDSRSITSNGSQSAEYTNALQRTLKVIEECGCDDDCGCDGLTRQQGGIWRDVHASASKQLKIGRSPEVVCFQLQRVVMNADGTLKKLTGHVTFPKILDLFPFTIAAESATQRRVTSASKTCGGFPFTQLDEGVRSYNKKDAQDAAEAGPNPVAEIPTSVPNGDSDLGEDQGKSKTDEISCHHPLQLSSDICSDDSALPVEEGSGTLPTDVVESAVVNEAVKLDRPSVQNPASGQVPADHTSSNGTDVPVEDFNSISSLLSTSSGSTFTSSLPTLPFYSPHVLSVFPRPLPLHSWSLATALHDEQRGSPLRIHGSMSESLIYNSSNSPNPTTSPTSRLFTETSKYTRSLLYDLVSVVVHLGGSQSGHYIVYRKMRLPVFEANGIGTEIPILDQPANGQVLEQNLQPSAAEDVFSGDWEITAEAGVNLSGNQTLAFDSRTQECFSREACDGGLAHPCEDPDDISVGVGLPEPNTVGSKSLSHENREGQSEVLKRGLDRFGTANSPPIGLWFRVSDTHVERVPEQEVLSAHASLLFYEQI